ncbi:hypothetical protein ABZ593_21145 [Streptomyces sp. NPDC012617]|uniref:hypothetical protein n=1 Tax=Streptomyces TaxID=1883 RepID=UPI0033F52848
MSAPGQRPDTSDGTIRTPQDIGETHDCNPLPTRADTVRTPPDSDGPDNDPGVRFAYRATVPRHLVGAAFAEAFAHLGEALQPEPANAPACCVCGEPSVYENYKGDLFCWPCADGKPVPAASADTFDLPHDTPGREPRC